MVTSFGMVLPADPRNVRIVRLVGSSIGTLGGFDDELIDDFKIALGELTSTLLEVGGASPVDITFDLDDAGRVEVRGTVAVEPGATVDPMRFAFTERVLTLVADTHVFDIGASTATLVMTISTTADLEASDA